MTKGQGQKPKKQNVKISKELRDIIHGYLASDGYLKPAGALTVDQSKAQEKFAEWLYEKLKPLRTDTPISQVTRIHPKTGKNTYSCRFNTQTLLKGFRAMWYPPYIDKNGTITLKKQLPKSLDCFFNATFLTLWFAGDGTKLGDSRGAKIEATAFTEAERLRLKVLFKKKFDIDVSINRAGKTEKGKIQWTINILSADYDKFRALITQMDLIPNLFPNKLCPGIRHPAVKK